MPSGYRFPRLSWGTRGCWLSKDLQGRHLDPVAVADEFRLMQTVVPLGGLGDLHICCLDYSIWAGDDVTTGTASGITFDGAIFLAAQPNSPTDDLVPHETVHAIAARLIDGVELAELRAILGSAYGLDNADSWETAPSERMAEYVSAALWGSPVTGRMPQLDAATLERVREWAIRAIGPAEPALIVCDGDTVISMTIGSQGYQVNGEPRTMDVAPFIQYDRTFVPVRFVSEAMGATVSWDDENQRVTIVLGGTTVCLTIGSHVYMINGEPRQMDACPQIVSDRTMVPVRFVAEALGTQVCWSEQSQTVTIVKS